jgi:hypothetical protein
MRELKRDPVLLSPRGVPALDFEVDLPEPDFSLDVAHAGQGVSPTSESMISSRASSRSSNSHVGSAAMR